MSFWFGKKKNVLKGDPSLIQAECSLNAVEKTWEKEDQGFLLELQNYEVETDVEMEQEMKGDEDVPMIKFLLQQYVDIFEDPKGLSPKREIDHRI